MPLRIQTETLHFKDEAGADIPDATFTIRRHLSHDGQSEYAQATTFIKVETDEDGDIAKGADGKPKTSIAIKDLDYKTLARILLRDSLISLTGVEFADGTPVPPARFSEFDEQYVTQVVKEIQRRNDQEDDTSPKSAAPPSGTSSSEAALSPSSTTTT